MCLFNLYPTRIFISRTGYTVVWPINNNQKVYKEMILNLGEKVFSNMIKSMPWAHESYEKSFWESKKCKEIYIGEDVISPQK